MQLKHTVVALAAAGLLSTQAHASEMQVEAATQPAQAVAAFTDADIGALFEASDKPMQLAALSEQEMKETEGAFFFVPMAIGAGFNALSYYYSVPSSQRSLTGWGIAVGSGALGGGIGGVGARFIGSNFGSLTGGAFTLSGSHIAHNWSTLGGSRRW